MKHVLMKFGLCHLVVLDDENPFKGTFISMSDFFHLNYDFLAKRNHKGLTVKKIHRFLNKSVTIAVEERSTKDIFVPIGIAFYACNSVPIDGTNILCVILAIGRELHFPIDINLYVLPKLTQNNSKLRWII